MSSRRSDPRPWVSGAILGQLSRYLDSIGIDLEALPAARDLDEALLHDPEARFPLEGYLRLEAEAAEASGDPSFGLHMGEGAVSGSWSVLGLMMMQCADLTEAFAKSAQYCAIIGTLVKGRSSRHGDRITIDLEPFAPFIPSRHCYEATLASLVSIMRDLAGDEIAPLEVGIPGPEPVGSPEYRRIFRCPVGFGAEGYNMVISASIGTIPLRFPNASLLARVEGYAREILRDIHEEHSLSRSVATLIASRLAEGEISIEYVARELALSVRTLQARLECEGQCFQDLLASTRLGLAKRYLGEGLSIGEISCLLGFSDPSILHRAFKKWTGLTPGEFSRSFQATGKIEGLQSTHDGFSS